MMAPRGEATHWWVLREAEGPNLRYKLSRALLGEPLIVKWDIM